VDLKSLKNDKNETSVSKRQDQCFDYFFLIWYKTPVGSFFVPATTQGSGIYVNARKPRFDETCHHRTCMSTVFRLFREKSMTILSNVNQWQVASDYSVFVRRLMFCKFECPQKSMVNE